MTFDEGLAERVRDLTDAEPSMSERKMFGGLCFMSSGHMCFGILGDEIMVRVGPDAYGAALKLPHAREMDFTGRSMKGMVYVDPKDPDPARPRRTDKLRSLIQEYELAV